MFTCGATVAETWSLFAVFFLSFVRSFILYLFTVSFYLFLHILLLVDVSVFVFLFMHRFCIPTR